MALIKKRFFFFLILICCAAMVQSQDTTHKPIQTTPLFNAPTNSVQIKTDSTKTKTIKAKSNLANLPDSIVMKMKHDPRKATFRSAVVPGWGQAYNHEYWKIPIVYGALAIPASLYIYNNGFYKKTKFAYSAVYAATLQTPINNSMLLRIDPKVLDRNTGQPLSLATYQSYRNSFKRNKDYCILYFFILWGVNVADATVFGHLKDFDVSDDLSMQIEPTYIPEIKSSGLSLVFNFKQPNHKLPPLQ